MSCRVEQIGDCTLYLGDCLEILPGLGIGSVDHVISDPPYEQIYQNSFGEMKLKDKRPVGCELSFQGIDLIRADVAKVVKAICSGWAIFFCNGEGLGGWRDDLTAAGAKYKTPLIWLKRDALPKFNGDGPGRGFEACALAWCGQGRSHRNGGGRLGIFEHSKGGGTRHGAHPTEKPEKLMAELVTLFSDPGQMVCDPFMGSGTTGVACAQHGRRFIGIEMDSRWFDIACQRIEAAYRQPSLLQPSGPVPEQVGLLDSEAES